jgi:hypothetical protein
MRFIMANSPNTFRPLARCAQGRCEPVAAPPAIWRSLAKPAWSMPCQGPGDSVPCRSWGLSESRGSRNARRAEDRRESRGASGTCVSFPSHHLPERMNGERLPGSRSPPRGRKPEVPTQSVFLSNHHLNKPRLQAVRPKAAPFLSFPPTSAPSWRPDTGSVQGIGDVRLGKCYTVRASSERRADPTVLPPLGAPVLRVSADTSVGGRAREVMRNSW